MPFMSRFQRIGSFWKAVINVSLLKDSETDSCDRQLPLLLLIIIIKNRTVYQGL